MVAEVDTNVGMEIVYCDDAGTSTTSVATMSIVSINIDSDGMRCLTTYTRIAFKGKEESCWVKELYSL